MMEKEAPEFVCPMCGYRAKSLMELKEHILKKHTLNREDIRGVRFRKA